MNILLKFFLSGLALSLFVLLLMGSATPTNSVAQEGRERPENEVLAQPVVPRSTHGIYEQISKLPESVRRSAPFAREYDYITRHANPAGEYNLQQRVHSFEQSAKDLVRDASISLRMAGKPTPLFSDAWFNISPQGAGSTSIAGCTNALAIDPNNTNIIYAGAAGGGVWKSTNRGASWMSLTDLIIPNQAVASIAIDPINSNTIYVGTGYCFSGVDELVGSGIYKSNDGGANWARIGASVFSGSVVKILVHPAKSNLVFASNYSGGVKGLYRSTDYGANWSKVFPANGAASGIVWDIVPGDLSGPAAQMYMIEGNNPYSHSAECGVYSSTNDGISWTKIGSASLPSGDLIGRAAIGCPLKAPSKVFVLFTDPVGDSCYFYKSTNSGSTFLRVPDAPSTLFKPNGQYPGQGWYDLILAVSPNSVLHDSVWVGGVEGYRNYDDGLSWKVYSSYSPDIPNYWPHVDQHSIALDPNDPANVFVGTDGGVYNFSTSNTNDGTEDWRYRSNGMLTMRFYHIGLDRSDDLTTWAGAQDNGTWKMINGAVAQQKFGGDGFQPIVSPASPNSVYTELPNGDLYRSTDGGAYWSSKLKDFSDGVNWDAPFRMDPSDPHILYLGRERLWKSVDDGISWNPISPSHGSGKNISAIAVMQKLPDQIYTGFDDGKINITRNGGNTWSDISKGLPDARVNSIVTNWQDSAFALASFASTTTARIMMSTNAGSSWSDVSGIKGHALPEVPVNTIAVDSVNPKTTWYAATDNGIYYTLDAGIHWSIAASGIGLVTCRDIQLHPNKTTLRVATFGRGIFECNVNSLPVELAGLEATKTLTGTMLHWHTDSETNIAGFYIERSINGAIFQSIHFLNAAGNSTSRKDYSFFDSTVTPGDYLFQIKEVDLNGTAHYSNHVELHYGNQNLIVYPNYPNPLLLGGGSTLNSTIPIGGIGAYDGVNPSNQTRFRYELPADDHITLRIYDARGAIVKTLLQDQPKTAGEQNEFWDGRDNNGRVVSSGAYFFEFDTQSGTHVVNKMVLISN